MPPVRNLSSPLVDKSGRIVQPWNSFFQQFTQKAPAVSNIFVSDGPFSYTTADPGNIYITGGTVTDVALIRGLVTINLDPAIQIVPMGIGDTIVVTYAALPTLQFLATY